MMIIELYFSKKEKKYYVVGDYECAKCGCPITGVGLMKIRQSGRRGEPYLYCNFCYQEFKAKEDGCAMNYVVIVERKSHLPKDTHRILDAGTRFQYGRGLGDAIVKSEEIAKDKSSTTIDRTRFSHLPSIKGAQIGADVSKRIEQLEKPIISEKQLDKMIEDSKNSQPLIESTETKRLENMNNTFPLPKGRGIQ